MPGPAPKRNSERRRRNAPRANTVKLPADGRKGRAPKWPFPSPQPKRWAQLWKTPQAVMWEKQHVEQLVARYVLLESKLADADSREAKTASFWATLRDFEDRLGLSPMSLMKLQWEVEGTTEDSGEKFGPQEANIISLQERAGFNSG